MKNYVNVFRSVLKAPLMYLPADSYLAVTAFLIGVDEAYDREPLLGFREWLAVRLRSGYNLDWPRLILMGAFPGDSAMHDPAGVARELNAVAIGALSDSLRDFLTEREAKGIRGIQSEYDQALAVEVDGSET